MRIEEIIKKLQKSRLAVLSFQDLKKMFGVSEDNTAYKIAGKLVKKEFLFRLKKGLFRSRFANPSDFEIANNLYTPSYVSFESALSFYGILPQFPYSVTSATSSKTKKMENNGKEYEYVRLQPGLFWGYEKQKNVLIALPEKALIDELYLVAKGWRRIDFDEIDYSKINKRRFKKMSKQIKHKPFQKLIKRVEL